MTVADLAPQDEWTKRALISDIAKTFDVLGWFAPVIVKAKILLQCFWEEGLGWDDTTLGQAWLKWRQLSLFHTVQLHGFSDASEIAYAVVVYLRLVNVTGYVHISLIMAKTKVTPIKSLSIPRLEFCGALLLARLLHHYQLVFGFPVKDIFAWTDSTIILNWLISNPRHFKTFVGNRISLISDFGPPNCWSHVKGSSNPADCVSRGVLPSELLSHRFWWNEPDWLQLGIHCWPKSIFLMPNNPADEVNEIMLTCCCRPNSIHFPSGLLLVLNE